MVDPKYSNQTPSQTEVQDRSVYDVQAIIPKMPRQILTLLIQLLNHAT